MATKTLNTKIQLRNGTAAEWTAKDPTLLKGEMGIEIDTHKIKVGDGSTQWSKLAYCGADTNDILNVINANRDSCTVIELAEGESTADKLSTIENPKKGDIAVIIDGIAGEAKSYTSYVYDGEKFAAMDGNYNASNVYFDSNFILTEAFGRYKPDSSGSVEVPASGVSVAGLIDDAYSKENNPTTTQPSASVKITAGNGTFEIGTKKNITYSASLNKGSYSYGPSDTGVAATQYTATFDGKTSNGQTGTFENVVAEGTKTLNIAITYSDGVVPKTNKGNPYADGKIKAGSKTAAAKDTLVGVRHMFYGALTEDTALTSGVIRGLNHEAAAKKTITTFGAGSGAKKVVIACPAGYNVTKVLMPSAMNADATASFVKQSATVNVEGAEGYTAVAYNVWVYQPASIDSSETYAVTIG